MKGKTMNIIIGKTSGFCYGVKRAVENTEQELQKNNKPIYCLGELVHNKDVIKELQEKGLKFIEKIEEAKGTAIIRAHGIKKEIYENAQKENIKLIDLTCPMVAKIHVLAEEYAQKEYYIFLIGKANHPEIIGTYSFCGENSTIIENENDIEKAIKEFEKTQLKNLLIIAQTTYNLKEFEKIVEQIEKNIKKDIKLEIKNTICSATEQRQNETEELSKQVELMIIVGGKNSSNTNKLYEISKNNCQNVIFAENEKDIDEEKILNFETIGIMAGASTPQKIVEKIVNKINETKSIVKKGEIYA